MARRGVLRIEVSFRVSSSGEFTLTARDLARDNEVSVVRSSGGSGEGHRDRPRTLGCRPPCAGSEGRRSGGQNGGSFCAWRVGDRGYRHHRRIDGERQGLGCAGGEGCA
jgi:hypothetical protein